MEANFFLVSDIYPAAPELKQHRQVIRPKGMKENNVGICKEKEEKSRTKNWRGCSKAEKFSALISNVGSSFAHLKILSTPAGTK